MVIEPAHLAAARLLWAYHRLGEPLPDRADVIVGLGSYDLRVADHCAHLHAAGRAPRILFTGRSGHWTQGRYPTTEAAAFRDRAIAAGVSPDAIAVEEEAGNLGENIAFTARLIAPTETVIIVTKPQTQRRLRAALDRQWPHGDGRRLTVNAPPTGFEAQPTADQPIGHLVEEMVGDLWRILEYPKLGFQTAQDIPAEVLAAYRQLRAAGFDGHVPAGG